MDQADSNFVNGGGIEIPNNDVIASDAPPVVPPKPRVWPTYLVLPFHLFLLLLASVALMLVHAGGKTDPQTLKSVGKNPVVRIQLYFLMAICGVVATLIPAVLSPVSVRKRLWLAPARVPISVLIAICFTGIALNVFVSCLIHLFSGEAGSLREFRLFIVDLTPVQWAQFTLVVGLAGPVGEELLFRGYIFSRMQARYGFFLAAFLSTLFFSIYHFDLRHSTIVFGFGFFAAYVSYLSKSIVPAIVMHCANNLFACCMLYFVRSRAELTLAEDLIWISAALLVMSFCLKLVTRWARTSG
jgi:uncharacterized protein